MVESRSPKPLVVGSSPTAPAKTHSDSSGCVFYFPGNSGAVWLISAPLTCSRSVDLRSPVERQLLDSTNHFNGCWGRVLGADVLPVQLICFPLGQDKAAISAHSAAALAAKAMPCVCVLPGSRNRCPGAGSAAYLEAAWVQVCIR